MARPHKPRFGELPPKYNFVLNPYSDIQFSRCPYCERKTGQRKIPLLIYIEPGHLMALNFTCRFCAACDLLIANKILIEHLLTELFRQHAPEVIGNGYWIVGSVEKTVWREGLATPKTVDEMLPHANDFARYYKDLRVTQAGWFRAGQKPPIMNPPVSREWVKSKQKPSRR